MAENQRPDTAKILKQLKNFQRDTVDYVFRRMYLDSDCARRFLIADEVGLGKTLVARGLIAKVIDHLWERSERIDIIYVCSNTDIARQNINRLKLKDEDHFALSERITLLPIRIQDLRRAGVNFISFTPGTSFELERNSGKSTERELLYWLLKEPWSLSFNRATVVLQGSAGIYDFRKRVRKFHEAIHPEIANQFADSLRERPQLRERFEALCDEMPKAGAQVEPELHRARNQFIGELRIVLAQTCLRWLEPDFIILDEFQRFKHLLQGEGEEASPARDLAHHLFNYQEAQADPALAARVLLLSATPYKMYTLSHETEEDDHYADFRNTLDFLTPDEKQKQAMHDQLAHYREELFRVVDLGAEGLLKAKQELERLLRRVMVRTERLAVSADRNGMLAEVIPESIPFNAGDVEQYLALQRVARLLEHDDVMEYWKSAPYLLNFMEDYDFKHKVRAALEDAQPQPELVSAVAEAAKGLLRRREIERYRQLDPGNARLRHLHQDIVARGAWRLLWMPASLPYYQGTGAFADPELARFTKRLIFSSWRVVPKAIAAVLSYEAERCMMQTFRKKAQNTAEARKRRRPLLRFTFREGKPTGMPVLALIYPCRTLASRFDPLRLRDRAAASAAGTLPCSPNTAPPEIQNPSAIGNALPSLAEVIEAVEPEIEALLKPLVTKLPETSGPVDEAWYWAAPLLLDSEYDSAAMAEWFRTDRLAALWSSGGSADRLTAGRGWRRHVEEAQRMALEQSGRTSLGPPPPDLAKVLARVAVAGPGVVALRSLSRIVPLASKNGDVRQFAGSLAHAFLHLFDLPEVMALLRDRQKQVYWQSVLEYCAAGNLQAVLDEYVHVLVESLGLADKAPEVIAKGVANEVKRCLTLRTSTAQADLILPRRRRVRIDPEPIRFRTRFAMRFGDQEVEDSSEPTRADLVRAAFNSPFWPFVLSTTSVGQEGLDFHTYCHAVVHWNLPSNPVDLEQREGRIHRYKGHAVRKNIAHAFSDATRNGHADPWAAMFLAAQEGRAKQESDLFPFWIVPNGLAKIERHLPTLPHSREVVQQDNLRRALVLYRMVFGQNRQEDIVHYLLNRLPAEEVERLMIDLSPQPQSEFIAGG